MERVMGIEPTLVAWEATVLPLNYTRARGCENSRARTGVTTAETHGTRKVVDRHGVAAGIPRAARSGWRATSLYRRRQGERRRDSRAPARGNAMHGRRATDGVEHGNCRKPQRSRAYARRGKSICPAGHGRERHGPGAWRDALRRDATNHRI